MFSSIISDASFGECWPQLRDRILTLPQVVILIESSFGTTSSTSSGGIRGLMVEIGLLQYPVSSNKDTMEVPFRSCWDNIRFVYQALVELRTLNFCLLDVKSNDSRISLMVYIKLSSSSYSLKIFISECKAWKG